MKCISYNSTTPNKTEINYAVIEKELLAIVKGYQKISPLSFQQRKFVILSGHKLLTWLFRTKIKDPGSGLVRWRPELEEYKYRIQYIERVVTDALSRISLVPLNDDKDHVIKEKHFSKLKISSYSHVMNIYKRKPFFKSNIISLPHQSIIVIIERGAI